MNLIRFDGCKVGDEVHLETGLPGLMQKWVSVITDESETDQEWFFVDEGRVLPFPLKNWKHTHRVLRDESGGAVIRDEIEFHCANRVIEFCMAPALWAAFSVRPRRYQEIFIKT
jgi:ligand-binding SRPBCC domain-containing protein